MAKVPTQASKKTKLRFTIDDDIDLLKEVLGANPYEDPKRWKKIHEDFVEFNQKKFSSRAVRDHVNHLVTLFKKEDLGNLRRSGTEEQYGEKEQLLQDLCSLKAEFEKGKKPRSIGEEIRAQACSSTQSPVVKEELILDDCVVITEGSRPVTPSVWSPAPSESPLPSVSWRPSSQQGTRRISRGEKRDILEYLETKLEADREIEKKKLKLQERQLDLEEKKIEKQFQLDLNKQEKMLHLEQQKTEKMILLEREKLKMKEKMLVLKEKKELRLLQAQNQQAEWMMKLMGVVLKKK